MKTFAAIDFETANNNRASVCSVGIVIVHDGHVEETFYSLIKPVPNFYTYWTTQVHGLTTLDTNDAPEFPEVWAKIASKLEGMILVAHNSPFDEGCLKAVHAWYDLAYPKYEFRCTCRASRKAFPHLINHQLHTVSDHCGFDLRHHHHALADAEAAAHIALQVF